MLVLTRKPGQRILIDNEIVLQILEVCGDRVRVGISAPDNVIVHREEVWLRIQDQADTTHFDTGNPVG